MWECIGTVTCVYTNTHTRELNRYRPDQTGPDTLTLAARGLEEPRNSQELLTESVDLTKFVGPLPFSA